MTTEPSSLATTATSSPLPFSLPQTLTVDTYEHTLTTLAQAFVTDELQCHLVRRQLGLDPSKIVTASDHQAMFELVLPLLKNEGAEFITILGQHGTEGESTVASSWSIEVPSDPHDHEEATSGTISLVPDLFELVNLAGPIWKREFPNGERVLCLDMIGNSASAETRAMKANNTIEAGQVARSKGASFLVREMLVKATEAGLPVILDASSHASRDVYSRLGFEVVGEIEVAKGRRDGDGQLIDEGRGFNVTLMKYDSRQSKP